MNRPRLYPKRARGERVVSIRTTHTNDALPLCGRCGRHVKNPSRAHKNPDGYQCRGVRPVALDNIPEVVIPRERPAPKQTSAQPRDEPPPLGRMARGACHDCDKPVTGERWYCGLCAALRQGGAR